MRSRSASTTAMGTGVYMPFCNSLGSPHVPYLFSSYLGGDRRDLHSIAKFSQAFDQAIFLLVGGTTIEVIAAEILICRPVLEHVVDRGKDGGGDGHDRLLGAAPGFDAVELGLQVAVFLFYRRPGALHQRGLEPGSSLAQAIGSTLAGTLVVARTYAGPRDEMCVRRESAHVDPDLGDDDVGAEVLDSWNRYYEVDCGAKGPKVRLHLRVHRHGGGIESVDLIEMKAQQEAMVLRHPAAKGLAELLRRRLHPPIRKAGQLGGIGFAGNQGLDHGAAALAH